MPTLSQKCKDVRISASMSQLEFAETIGTTQRRISHYEVGDKPIPFDDLVRYADFAGQTVSEFVADVDTSIDQGSDETIDDIADRVIEVIKPMIFDVVKQQLNNRR